MTQLSREEGGREDPLRAVVFRKGEEIVRTSARVVRTGCCVTRSDRTKSYQNSNDFNGNKVLSLKIFK